jgi:hypothetical protein
MPDPYSLNKTDSRWKRSPSYIEVTVAPGDPAGTPNSPRNPVPAKVAFPAPTSIMKRCPAPGNQRTPGPAIICPNPLAACVWAPAAIHVGRNPHILVDRMIDPYSIRRKVIVKIRYVHHSRWLRDSLHWIFLYRRRNIFDWSRKINVTASH